MSTRPTRRSVLGRRWSAGVLSAALAVSGGARRAGRRRSRAGRDDDHDHVDDAHHEAEEGLVGRLGADQHVRGQQRDRRTAGLGARRTPRASR